MGKDMGNTYYEPLPVWAEGNVYLNGARPWKKEKHACVPENFEAKLDLVETGEGIFLESNLSGLQENMQGTLVATETLGIAFEPEQRYENPDGTPIIFDTDYKSRIRENHVTAGPFETISDRMVFW